MVVVAVLGGLFFLGVVGFTDVCFETDDGFDTLDLASLKKLDGTVEDAVVGDGKGSEFLLFGLVDKVANFGQAVKE